MKICARCNNSFELEGFEYNKTKKLYRNICRTCRNLQIMEARYSTKDNHIKRKLSRLKERAKRLDCEFNLTYSDLLVQPEKQGEKCLKHRSQRPSDVEQTFGNLKANKNFKRFLLRGLVS